MTDLFFKVALPICFFVITVYWETVKEKDKAKKSNKPKTKKHSTQQKIPKKKPLARTAREKTQKRSQKKVACNKKTTTPKTKPSIKAQQSATAVAQMYREQPKKERLQSRLGSRAVALQKHAERTKIKSRYADRSIKVELTDIDTREQKSVIHFHEEAILEGMVWHEILSSKT